MPYYHTNIIPLSCKHHSNAMPITWQFHNNNVCTHVIVTLIMQISCKCHKNIMPKSHKYHTMSLLMSHKCHVNGMSITCQSHTIMQTAQITCHCHTNSCQFHVNYISISHKFCNNIKILPISWEITPMPCQLNDNLTMFANIMPTSCKHHTITSVMIKHHTIICQWHANITCLKHHAYVTQSLCQCHVSHIPISGNY